MAGSELITADVAANIIDAEGGRHPLSCKLDYVAADPFAVRVTFADAQGPEEMGVTWVMARDLLVASATGASGEGDVHAWPGVDDDGRHIVGMLLCSPDGEALIEIQLAGLLRFLDDTKVAVPLGSESELLDVDQAIARIFASAQVGGADED